MQDKGTESIFVVYDNLYKELQEITKETDNIDAQILKLQQRKSELITIGKKKQLRVEKLSSKIDKYIELQTELISHMKQKIDGHKKKQKGGENDT